MMEDLEAILGAAVVAREPLHGGCVADVTLLGLKDGRRIVAKRRNSPKAPSFDTEGWMLALLATKGRLPVPQVLHATPDLLLLDFVHGSSGLSVSAQEDAAERIATLHAVEGQAFGLERTTPIGALPQDNRWQDSWLNFFRDQRLMPMARLAHARGRLSDDGLHKVERLAERLERWLREPRSPALLHGDLWGGNIITRNGEVAAFLDPAVYYGHPEIELAFGTLFGTLDKHFFGRYADLRPLEPGFLEERRDLYNLYPLLVHAAMFGGSYGPAVVRILDRYL